MAQQGSSITTCTSAPSCMQATMQHTFGSLPLSILPIWRAIRVLPVPGGPNSSIPCNAARTRINIHESLRAMQGLFLYVPAITVPKVPFGKHAKQWKNLYKICGARSTTALRQPLQLPGQPTLTCWIPSRCTMLGGNTRLAKARLKIASNCLSRPPMPRLSKLRVLALNSCVVAKPFWPTILMLWLSVATGSTKATTVGSRCNRQAVLVR